MTLADAAGLAILANHDRRLVAAILRSAAGRSTAEDSEALPARLPDEPLVLWACRCRVSRQRPCAEAEFRRTMREADDQIARACALGVSAVPFGDERYPPRLAAIADPPPVLWVRGHVPSLSSVAIGIVGSRSATCYGLEMARRLAIDLSAAGLTVVSGLARGVDSAAHRSVVAARGCTVGVLGCGIDRIYPSEHLRLARDMECRGAVVSEFPPGVPPLPHHFPLRNRIISGLSVAVVVVEAPERSGSLITASTAAEQGRDVLVVPGLVDGGRNRGGHLLIRDGAKLVESVDDILQELNLGDGGARQDTRSLPTPSMEAFTVDEIAAQTGEQPPIVLAHLLQLELAGRIQRIGGGRFVRVLSYNEWPNR
jgi:DNA processing protein